MNTDFAAWERQRTAFEARAAGLPDGATDQELNDYWAAWNSAMKAEASGPEAIRWKISQLVAQTAETGEFADQDSLIAAIMSDVERYAARGGAA